MLYLVINQAACLINHTIAGCFNSRKQKRDPAQLLENLATPTNFAIVDCRHSREHTNETQREPQGELADRSARMTRKNPIKGPFNMNTRMT